tara:strand:- start:823 stop:2133 length:1311 start_codon:yes stop_codon:yes gene_type:complete
MIDLIIENGKIVSHKKVIDSDIAVKNGKIFKIGKLNKLKSKQRIDASGLHILPGVFDTQVHFREPGNTKKENLKTGSLSAVAGGITTVFDMPNNKPSITTKKLFKDKLKKAKNRMYANYAFYFGAEKNNIKEINKVEKLDGCCGIKVFVGSSTGTLLVSNYEDIGRIMKNTRKIISFHSEDEDELNKRKKYIKPNDPFSHPKWRNEVTAMKSTRNLINLANKYKRKIHILHISTGKEIDILRKQKKYITCEVTPQHLTLSSPSCYKNLGTLAQMNPPIRNEKHMKLLRKAFKKGQFDVVGSDHAPHLLSEKRLKYPKSPAGMPGVQTLLPILLNEVSKNFISITDIVRLTSYNPKIIFKFKNKGLIKKGYDADFTFVDLNKKQKISNKMVKSRCGWTPFHGMNIQGWPVGTMIMGKKVFWRDKLVSKPIGKPLKFN